MITNEISQNRSTIYRHKKIIFFKSIINFYQKKENITNLFNGIQFLIAFISTEVMN